MEFDLPRPLSHSSISMYIECPQKYKFKYIDKIPEKPRHFFSFGSSVHQALEFLYDVKELPAPSLVDLLANYEEHWISAGYKDEEQEAEYFQKGKDILRKYYEKHIDDFFIPLFVEYNFRMEVDGVPVTGKVDRVDKMPDGKLLVLDYKTGKKIPSDRVLTDFQLTMYQYACEELLQKKVGKLVFYHLPSLTELTVKRHGAAQVKGLKERILTTAEGITKGRFEPLPEERKCFWCDFKPLCPVFKHQYPDAAAPRAVPVPAPAPTSAPAAEGSVELVSLVDRYGELEARMSELAEEADEVKQKIIDLLKSKGYVRAFGKKYELTRAGTERWEFSDKKRVLDLLRKAGLYDRVLAPSAPLVQQLMTDPRIDPKIKAALEGMGVKVDTPELKVRPL